jgi:hypothetical protein
LISKALKGMEIIEHSKIGRALVEIMKKAFDLGRKNYSCTFGQLNLMLVGEYSSHSEQRLDCDVLASWNLLNFGGSGMHQPDSCRLDAPACFYNTQACFFIVDQQLLALYLGVNEYSQALRWKSSPYSECKWYHQCVCQDHQTLASFRALAPM